MFSRPEYPQICTDSVTILPFANLPREEPTQIERNAVTSYHVDDFFNCSNGLGKTSVRAESGIQTEYPFLVYSRSELAC